MKLYAKIVQFMRPFWKHILSVLILTLFYVFFNNLSLWISVDFIKELFDPAQVTQTASVSDSTQAKITNPAADVMAITTKGNNFYHEVKRTIKGWLIRDNRQDTLITVCFLIFLTFLLKNITLYGRRILLNFIELKIIVNIRNQLHNKMLHLPLGYFDHRHSGELNSVVFNDVNAINVVLDTSFGKMILAPVQIGVNIFILFMISWKLSLVTFIIIPLSGFVMTKIGKSMRRRSRRVFQQIADVVSLFQEAITGIRIVKAFATEPFESEKFEASNHQYFKKTFRQQKLRYLTSPINETMYVTILVFLLWYGGNLVYSHSGLTAEDFIRFLLFLFTMFQPLKELSGVNNVIQNGLAAAERIFEVLEAEEEVYDKPGAKDLQTFSRNIRYENTSFTYNTDEKPVLRNINLEINKGDTVALVGPSGAGKTTLVNLLPRFYECTGGRITIDGTDVQDLTLASLRQHIGIVTQDTILFNDTIRANIAYSKADIPEEQIIHAAKAANAWEFIEKMPKGLDTFIGEKGTRLSGGQKQRLSIARAILKNPPILILDEATSALDTESERLVQNAIEHLLESRTVLVIAHRLSTIQNADKIVVLKDGQIDSIGTHQELLDSSALYKNLYENQLLAGKESS